MVEPTLERVLSESVRVLFLGGLPLLIAITLGGFLGGILQAITSIREPVIGFACKIAGATIALYLFLPSLARSMTNLAELVYR